MLHPPPVPCCTYHMSHTAPTRGIIGQLFDELLHLIPCRGDQFPRVVQVGVFPVDSEEEEEKEEEVEE